MGGFFVSLLSSAFVLLASMSTRFWIGYIAASLLGLAMSCLLYGAIGYLLFGHAGLIAGCVVAIGFALFGLRHINPLTTPELFDF